MAENAYSVIPHTSKCLVAIHCGIEPRPTMPIRETEPNGIAAKCIPKLLNEQGYKTAFFQTPTEHFEKRRYLVKNLGHTEFFPGEVLPKKGFEDVNYFGYEDRVLLGPSKAWHKNLIKNHSGVPFMVTYLTNTTHHDHTTPSTHKFRRFHPNGFYNRYLNSVNYLDGFVRDLIEQYKELGIYKNTIFVLVADHGEGFREHGLYSHSNTIYQEGLRIPLIIHDPTRFKRGFRIKRPVYQPDILPTVLNLLEFNIINNTYRAYDMLAKRNHEYALNAACWNDRRCIVRYNATYKLIHYFNSKPDEVYNLIDDPGEKKNIAKSFKDLLAWRTASVSWYNNLHGLYRQYQEHPEQYAQKTQ